MSLELITQLLYALVGAGAVYGGIRADLRAMHERIESAERSAGRAHARIDSHLEKGTP